MKQWEIMCSHYGVCRVKAETPAKARYQAYLKWREAYRPTHKGAYLEFMRSIEYVADMGKMSSVYAES